MVQRSTMRTVPAAVFDSERRNTCTHGTEDVCPQAVAGNTSARVVGRFMVVRRTRTWVRVGRKFGCVNRWD